MKLLFLIFIKENINKNKNIYEYGKSKDKRR